MRFICRKNSSDVTNFTEGRIYEEVGRQGNLYGINDDLGRLRYILPDEPSAHLVRQVRGGSRYLDTQVVCGHFETVKDP